MPPSMSSNADMPLVSVVTAALNPPLDKLERCIRCVEDQTYPNVEHVVVDGGSTNGALDVLRGHERVRWISEPDEGQCDAMNKAIFVQSKGELIVWLNADDLLYPESVELAAEIFRRDPAVGWVYGDLDREEGGRRTVIRPPREASREELDFNNVGTISPGTMFARWALEKAGPLDERFKMEMDLDLSLRLIEAGVASCCVPRALALLEIYDGTKSAEARKRDIAEERHRIYLEHGMFQQAGAALALAGRYEISEEIEAALAEGRYRDASAAAAKGLRFMPSVLERHRVSFLLTRLFPRAMRRVKRALKRF
jgi:GT2 family glycosyltransferase